MSSLFPLAPRYRLDDEQPWLEGIDPSRHYWLRVNSDTTAIAPLPGLTAPSLAEFKAAMRRFRSLQPGETMTFQRAAATCEVVCVSQNCYAIATTFQGNPIWHLFDCETLDSLLMTGHPDWQCSPQDVALGRRLLLQSWQQPSAA